MWTYQIKNKNKSIEGFNVEVEYVNGKLVYSRTYSINSVEDLKSLITNQLARFTNSDTLDSEINIGNFDLTPAPPTVDQITQAKLNYLADIQLSNQCEKAIAAGLMKPTEPKYVDCQARLKANYSDDYLGLLAEYKK